MSGVSIYMFEYYNLSHFNDRKAIYPYYKADENVDLMNCIRNSCLQYGKSHEMTTAIDGKFSFNDLTMLFRPSLKKVDDPYRSLLNC